MIIRPETSSDISAVRQVVISAFGQNSEADLVDALRDSGDAVISLVAEDEGEIVGHIMFSKLQQPDQCLGLAPVSVLPVRQKQNTGSTLIREGLGRVAQGGWHGVFVLGDPGYYQRFGFSTAMADKFETEYPKEYFMALEPTPNSLTVPGGAVVYAPPFLALG